MAHPDLLADLPHRARARRPVTSQPGPCLARVSTAINRRRIVGMNDRLYGIDQRVAEKGGEGRADHRFPGNLAILFGHIAAGAIAAPGCDDDGCDLSRNGTSIPHIYDIALAQVQQPGLVAG